LVDLADNGLLLLEKNALGEQRLLLECLLAVGEGAVSAVAQPKRPKAQAGTDSAIAAPAAPAAPARRISTVAETAIAQTVGSVAARIGGTDRHAGQRRLSVGCASKNYQSKSQTGGDTQAVHRSVPFLSGRRWGGVAICPRGRPKSPAIVSSTGILASFFARRND